MKRSRIFAAGLALLALSTFSPQLSTAFAQGSLTPPGAPAPTMKTADQIEPRTIVNAVNTPGNADSLFVISQPGSYYLTTNLVGVSYQYGIEIAANNVTLDLNGFTLQGVPSSYRSGIIVPNAQTNITVRNGSISGWAFYGNNKSGVESDSNISVNQVFERLNVSDCCNGITLNGAGVVRDCNCQHNSGVGISCNGGIVSGCTVNNGYEGIEVTSGTVSRCLVRNNSANGIVVVGPYSAVIGNTCIGNNTDNYEEQAGILIEAANNRIEDNHVSASGCVGISAWGISVSNNIIIKNRVAGNGDGNYDLDGAQIVGPIITNTVSGIITNSNPWANFSF